MVEYLRLPRQEQARVLLAVADRIGTPAEVLEKDVWLCWVLRELFSIQSNVRMSFKGGTSLSKVFGVIQRFSEDIDITLDYRDLIPDVAADPLSQLSRSALKRYSEQLKRAASAHVGEILAPRLESAFRDITNGEGAVEIDASRETIMLIYPRAIEHYGTYLTANILLEFGGRNATEPNGPHLVRTQLTHHVTELDLPEATVMVLAPERTFWEKATLIHAACNREADTSPARLSRHWYDLFMLLGTEIGTRALADRSLLEDVVRHKHAFFYAGHARYEDCLGSTFRLIPSAPFMAALERDFMAMNETQMFEVSPPSMSGIMERLGEVERLLNG